MNARGTPTLSAPNFHSVIFYVPRLGLPIYRKGKQLRRLEIQLVNSSRNPLQEARVSRFTAFIVISCLTLGAVIGASSLGVSESRIALVMATILFAQDWYSKWKEKSTPAADESQ